MVSLSVFYLFYELIDEKTKTWTCRYFVRKRTMAKKRTVRLPNRQPSYRQTIALFTVSGGNEAGVDLVLIEAFLLRYVHYVVLTLTNIFQALFPLEKDAGSY